MNKKILLFFLSAVLVLFLNGGRKKEVTLNSLIGEMTGRGNLSYFPQKEFSLLQFSSYNRASVSPDKDGWFANQDMSHFIRVENNKGRREFVMFDTNGPGAIVRWWMTFYKAQNGIIRIYIDSDTVPVIQGRPDELLSGKLLTSGPLAVSVQAGAELGEKGRDYDHNLYVPIPFRLHCKITYECNLLEIRYQDESVHVPQGFYWPDVFYNIDYRAYSENTSVGSFSQTALKDAGLLLKDAGESLLNNQVRSSSEQRFSKLILPGDSLVIAVNRNQYAIDRLMVELTADNMPQALRSTVLQASFDGCRTIWTPLGEFFGAGYNLNTHKTWMNQRDQNGRMESFWIMPFREKCRLTIINYGSENVFITGLAGLIPYKWESNSMYFGSSWHEYYHIKSRNEKGKPFDLNFIDIKGKGVYVGDQVTLFNNTYEWWGEGDEKIFVDGEKFPSSFGTGSEDYYGYSFARQESFSHPFLSQPVGTGNMNWGVTVNMRHRSLDRIPFNDSLSSNIELWHWANIRMNYALTSYYYVMPPFKVSIRPDIEGVRHKVALQKGDISEVAENELVKYYSAGDFVKVSKTDSHFHYLTMNPGFMRFASSLNFRLLTPIWNGEEVSISDQMKVATSIHNSFTGKYAFFATFPVDSFNYPGFAGKTIDCIRKSIAAGASGIKIWKNIGMVLKDRNGKYVMIDDPAFEPVFKYLEDNKIPVIAHLGEPKDCWLPQDKMTDPSDVFYYKNNPQYYMYIHPEVPSYEKQIEARDNILRKHPHLDFVGAHLGSLEWSVDELSERLDKYPNFKVDLAARMFHVQYQSAADYNKIRDFMIKYQDRILYGTDDEVHDIEGLTYSAICENLKKGWFSQWLYLATDSTVNNIKGLKLPAEVIDKIYFKNADRFFSIQMNQKK